MMIENVGWQSASSSPPAPSTGPAAASATPSATPAGPATPASFGDGFASGAQPPDPSVSDAERLARLALGKGPASLLEALFGKETYQVERLERMPSDKDHPAGGWRIVCRYPPSVARGTCERTLSDEAPPGWSTAWGQFYNPPLGCWTRRPDGWESSYRHVEKDPDSALESSMLRLFLGSDGKAEMVLWERLREGGGIFYRLDAQDWLQHPTQSPKIVDMVPYGPDAPEEAPFFKPGPTGDPPLWSQFFGPAAPVVKIGRFVPNESVPKGGVTVNLKFEWGGTRESSFCLHETAAPGYVHTSYRMEDQVHQCWVRQADSWVCETKARMTPDHHAKLRDVTLRTEVGLDGVVRSMVMTAEGLQGDRTEYVLDSSKLVTGETREPSVIDVRRFAAPERPERPRPVPKKPTAPTKPDIQQEDGWIIINGVRVPKKQG